MNMLEVYMILFVLYDFCL